jgi:tetratricopeptide (TPR) repeat protein
MEWLEQRIQTALASGATDTARAALWHLFELHEETNADLTVREAALVRIQELAAKDPRMLRSLAALYRKSERLPAAAETMAQLMDVAPSAEAIKVSHELADLAQGELADLPLAERALRRALELEPAHSATRTRLREVLRALQAYARLAQFLEQDLQLTASESEQALLLREIASVRAQHLSDGAGAVAALERAVRLAPNDRESLMSLCDMYVTAGRSAEAIAVLEKLIASYGGRRAKEVAVFEHRLGQAHEATGSADEALKHYDNAFKIDLTSVAVLRDLGRLCLVRGDLDRAQKTYRALLLQKLGDDQGITKSEVYYRLGEISAKQGDKVKAKAMLERAISEGGQYAPAKALLEQL